MGEVQKSFEECVAYRRRLTNIMTGLKKVCDADETCRRRLLAFAERRGLPIEFIDAHGIFYMSEKIAKAVDKKKKVQQPDDVTIPPKEDRDKENLWRLKSRKLFRFIGATTSTGGTKRNILENRVIYPLYSYISDEDNTPLVCGVCGYDMADGALAKYIYCQTPYFNRVAYLYGEENFLNFTKYKAIFVAEGLVDKLWLEYAIQNAGFDFPALAVCGVTTHDIKMSKIDIISNYNHIFYFPDRDKSGAEMAETLVKRFGKKITLCYVKFGNKDVADYFSGRNGSCDFYNFNTLLSNTQDGLPCGAEIQV